MGVFLENESTVNIYNCDINFNNSSSFGGGLYFENNTTIDINTCAINLEHIPSGFDLKDSNLNINNSNIATTHS